MLQEGSAAEDRQYCDDAARRRQSDIVSNNKHMATVELADQGGTVQLSWEEVAEKA